MRIRSNRTHTDTAGSSALGMRKKNAAAQVRTQTGEARLGLRTSCLVRKALGAPGALPGSIWKMPYGVAASILRATTCVRTQQRSAAASTQNTAQPDDSKGKKLPLPGRLLGRLVAMAMENAAALLHAHENALIITSPPSPSAATNGRGGGRRYFY